jgi:Uri superfamily endonuclease
MKLDTLVEMLVALEGTSQEKSESLEQEIEALEKRLNMLEQNRWHLDFLLRQLDSLTKQLTKIYDNADQMETTDFSKEDEVEDFEDIIDPDEEED